MKYYEIAQAIDVRSAARSGREELKKWLDIHKAECTVQLGDCLTATDLDLATQIYHIADCPLSVIKCFIEAGKFEHIPQYSKRVKYIPDYDSLAQHVTELKPGASARFASFVKGLNLRPQSLACR